MTTAAPAPTPGGTPAPPSDPAPVGVGQSAFGSLLLRVDPGCSHADLALARRPVYDTSAALAGSIVDSLPLVVRSWDEVSPDPAATDAMTSVLITLVGIAAGQHRITRWADIPPALAHQFVLEDGLDADAAVLAKNTIHAAYLALADHGVPTGFSATGPALSPVHGLLPVPGQVRVDQRGTRRGAATAHRNRNGYDQQVHVRPATHDEVLLVRLAASFAQTSRTRHLAAAALAICSSTATTSEAPQILWRDLDLAGATIALPGRPADRGWAETAIATRTNRLDPWDVAALTAWQAERRRAQPVPADASVLYGGNQPLTSTSAQVCADQQVRKLLKVADLRREPGLSAGSFRYWAAADHGRKHGLTAAAAYAGVQPTTLYRQLFQLGERALYTS
ncbi:hypothetical protein M6B22_13380 [Jatrophihabitans cynanchi]|uniref:Tyr recombinase domain-containing protein n=1 Tax=Jatrophihabitans cynanchi TaxID=2944128 RepID=A0ABY7JW54_9ACTN|nr:hypothetical protein [Jatrophihabitans sp. SB3-54]WAX55532.1 hypothetical protein M6B22_13380 [Jatrophihabitans sp. SB3-54]